MDSSRMWDVLHADLWIDLSAGLELCPPLLMPGISLELFQLIPATAPRQGLGNPHQGRRYPRRKVPFLV